MLLPLLRERVNAALGPGAVGRIQLTQAVARLRRAAGRLPAGAAAPAPTVDIGEVAGELSSIGDGDLRDALETLARNVLSRTPQPETTGKLSHGPDPDPPPDPRRRARRRRRWPACPASRWRSAHGRRDEHGRPERAGDAGRVRHVHLPALRRLRHGRVPEDQGELHRHRQGAAGVPRGLFQQAGALGGDDRPLRAGRPLLRHRRRALRHPGELGRGERRAGAARQALRHRPAGRADRRRR